MNGGKPDWLDRKGAAVFFGASVISLLFGNALVAAIPVVCGQKVQRITNERNVDLTGALIFQKRDCFAMQKQPVREIGLDPGYAAAAAEKRWNPDASDGFLLSTVLVVPDTLSGERAGPVDRRVVFLFGLGRHSILVRAVGSFASIVLRSLWTPAW